MASYNVILGKLNKGKRLTVEEIEFVTKHFAEHKRTHAIWKKYPCVWECSNCHNHIRRVESNGWTWSDDYIKAYHYCDCCGAKMEVIE